MIPIYYLVSVKWQNYLILYANILFLYYSDTKSLALCLISILFQFYIYKKILQNQCAKVAQRKWLIFGVVTQFAVLIFFKVISSPLNPLPFGVSYYSLMLTAFLLETYWNRQSVHLKFTEFITTASFFPIVMMGPLERIGRFGQQFLTQRELSPVNFKLGLYSVALGIFKITAISNILLSIIDHELPGSQNIQGLGLVLYCFFSFVKVYTNFSGYIDIIQGISQFLGFKISANFNQPYLARNIPDIWHRWHISLTLWLRDFVYLPILLKTKNMYLSSLAVICSVGIWHGLGPEYANWIIYWICLFALYTAFIRLQTKSFIFAFFKIKSVSTFLTLVAVSLSTLCFMIPYQGIINLIVRLFSINADNFNSFARGCELSNLKWVFLIISLCVTVLFESPRFRNNLILYKSKILFLIFLCAFLGEIKSSSFLYLHL